jgi:GNAT superfamily N-acetyltransferase
MRLQIREENPRHLAEYADVPIAFLVREVFEDAAIERLRHGEDSAATAIAVPYRKDYDAYPGNHPRSWAARYDVATWLVLAAYDDGRRVGGAVLVVDDSRPDVPRGEHALLWDLRVAVDERRRGVGGELLRAAERSAASDGARELRVETQQINVPACRFYLGHGFSLESVRAGAYPDLPDEVQLIWMKTLGPA